MSGALLEAMACGCPVLARDVPGNRALVAAPNSGSSVVGRRRGPGWEEVESGLLFSTPAGFAGAAAAALRGEAQEAAARAQVGSPPPLFCPFALFTR
jgi:glycosyltransferase involved in cell wall biosynthesis